MDRRGGQEHRRALLERATGVVVEVGSGAGTNFTHYPAGVTRVLAFEPDPYLRSLSAEAAASAPVAVEVGGGVAEALPVPDSSADTVVASLVLCSVTDVRLALRESRRVLRPGATLLFYEHVRSTRPLLGLVEDAVTPLWRRMAGNCHPNRDTLAAIGAAGFEVTDVRSFGFAPGGWPPLRHILGAARAPLA
ncbi:MAG: methyltransferase type 11 [Naasia sp.]|jgi:ubiquinone/menaquinone biosynthesis C-methylase UbiE|nr:methyltransferase type 11 [Naasia sp.]